jgi:hypothetical protein
MPPVEQGTVQQMLNVAYSNFPYDLCLVASPNIPSKNIVTSRGMKLKMSLESYLPDLVCVPVSLGNTVKIRQSSIRKRA